MDIIINKLQEAIRALQTKRITQTDILPKAVKQRHIEALIIFTGLDAAKPTDAKNDPRQAFFATDTFKLYLSTGSVYKSTTLS